jgi:hypothetical protein
LNYILSPSCHLFPDEEAILSAASIFGKMFPCLSVEHWLKIIFHEKTETPGAIDKKFLGHNSLISSVFFNAEDFDLPVAMTAICNKQHFNRKSAACIKKTVYGRLITLMNDEFNFFVIKLHLSKK